MLNTICVESERNRLVVEHMSYARKVAWYLVKKYNLPESWVEDCFAEAVLALVEIAGRFDEKRDIDFSAFCYARVRGAIIDHIRRTFSPSGKRTRRSNDGVNFATDKDYFEYEDQQGNVDFYSLEGSPESFMSLKETGSEIKKMMKKLTEQERFVIYHHYMLGKKFVEISRELKLGASWISRIHSSAIKKMRVAHPCYNNTASVQAS